MTTHIDKTANGPINVGSIVPIKILEEQGFQYACRVGQNKKDCLYKNITTDQTYLVTELNGHNKGKFQIIG